MKCSRVEPETRPAGHCAGPRRGLMPKLDPDLGGRAATARCANRSECTGRRRMASLRSFLHAAPDFLDPREPQAMAHFLPSCIPRVQSPDFAKAFPRE